MSKVLTCIECPKSCALAVDIENCRVVKISGNQCPRGEDYARAEVENPQRVLTGAVLTEGLAIRMVPVRTDKPIPKARILEAAAEIKKLKVTNPLGIGDIIVPDFMGLAVNLIATRDVA